MAVAVDLNFDESDNPSHYVVEQDVTIRIPVADTVSWDWKEESLPYIDSLIQENNERENPINNPRIIELFDGSDSPIGAIVSPELYDALSEYL